MLEGGNTAVEADIDVVGASQVRDLEKRVRELERLLGRKTMEAEILKPSRRRAQKKPTSPLVSWNPRNDGSRVRIRRRPQAGPPEQATVAYAAASKG